MAALTIRHGGLVASGQTIHGTGRPGSVGIYVPPGLGLVVIDGFTIRGFDYGIVADSPVVVTNSEVYRYRQAGLVLRAGESYVEFCSFLDIRTDGLIGAAIVATDGSGGVVVANSLYHIQGSRRWFALRHPGRTWTAQGLIGVAPQVEGDTREPHTSLQNAVPQVLQESGHTEGDPRYARIEEGSENLLLLHTSPAIRAVRGSLLPALGDRYDATTRLPQVDRADNRRAVDFLTAGAHEMSFAITQGARVRMLELIGGIEGAEPFDHAASGRDGTFNRLPSSQQNPTDTLITNPVDIQPSRDLSVLTVSDSLVGDSSGYFKAEADNQVPFVVSAAPSRKSDFAGAEAATFLGWAKAESVNADTVFDKAGRGVAQDQSVAAARFRFQGEFKPNLSLKLKGSDIARDYTFVVEDSEALEHMQAVIDDDVWFFWAWRFDGLRAEFLLGRADENFLRAYPARPHVFDELTEVMVGTIGVLSFGEEHVIVDGNDQRVYVGSDADGAAAWHGFLDDVRLDIGEEASREALLEEFQSRAPLSDITRLTRKIPKTDLLIARDRDVLIKVPEVAAGKWPGIGGVFASIKRVVQVDGTLVIAGARVSGEQEGVYLTQGAGLETVIENIPEILDIAIDREGDLVILATDVVLSRLDFDEGVRREVTLDDPPEYEFRSIAIAPDNAYVIGDSGAAGRVVLVRPPRDIASTDPASTEVLDFEEVELASVDSIAVTEDGDVYVLDAETPQVVKIGTVRVAQQRLALGVNVSIAAGGSLTLTGVDLNDLGVAIGDRVAFIAAAADLQTPEGEVVATSGDPVVPDNAGEFVARTVEGSTMTFDRSFVSESPTAGMQFELRIYRRNTTVLVMQEGAPLVAPTAVAYDPGNPGFPILISDPEAVRAGVTNHQGVIYRLGVGGELEELWYRGNFGYDLDEMNDIVLRQNPNLAPTVVASKLRSRMSWHMEIDPSSPGTIPNAAFPGLSDLDVPLISLNELLLVQPATVRVEEDGDDVLLVFDAVFGVDPRLDRDHLDADYENLSELGIVTKDGVVLLGRQTLARVPYDPLSPVLTRWRQGLRIGRQS